MTIWLALCRKCISKANYTCMVGPADVVDLPAKVI